MPNGIIESMHSSWFVFQSSLCYYAAVFYCLRIEINLTMRKNLWWLIKCFSLSSSSWISYFVENGTPNSSNTYDFKIMRKLITIRWQKGCLGDYVKIRLTFVVFGKSRRAPIYIKFIVPMVPRRSRLITTGAARNCVTHVCREGVCLNTQPTIFLQTKARFFFLVVPARDK